MSYSGRNGHFAIILDDVILTWCVRDQDASETSFFLWRRTAPAASAVFDDSHEGGIYPDVNVQTVLTLRLFTGLFVKSFNAKQCIWNDATCAMSIAEKHVRQPSTVINLNKNLETVKS